jgi:hypothetical protein
LQASPSVVLAFSSSNDKPWFLTEGKTCCCAHHTCLAIIIINYTPAIEELASSSTSIQRTAAGEALVQEDDLELFDYMAS